MAKNNVKKLREERLMSKTELARKAGVSPLTIARIEEGQNCRMETKRKIIFALGLGLADKHKVFGNDENQPHTAPGLQKAKPGEKGAAGPSSRRKTKTKRRSQPGLTEKSSPWRKKRP